MCSEMKMVSFISFVTFALFYRISVNQISELPLRIIFIRGWRQFTISWGSGALKNVATKKRYVVEPVLYSPRNIKSLEIMHTKQRDCLLEDTCTLHLIPVLHIALWSPGLDNIPKRRNISKDISSTPSKKNLAFKMWQQTHWYKRSRWFSHRHCRGNENQATPLEPTRLKKF